MFSYIVFGKKLHIYLILILIANKTFSQEIQLKGKVTNSLQAPLIYANILAFPEESYDSETSFAITNEKGDYFLQLQKNIPYQLTISYLGYTPLEVNITLKENSIKDFLLVENINTLDGVEVMYKIPIQIKKDTTTYNIDAFVNGKERKLREVLKKLPGLEVDREGNVTSNGKKITKVLVDNKLFFTGNSKMAVNNIPANVIEQIVILDNYSEVAMLKGLQDSDEMALNIKLKKDKKKFIFGDLEGGGGFKERYTIHPTFFYYSPKTNINFIGDINNIGVKEFSLSDYLEFEGGFGKLLNNSGSYFNLFTDDFAQFLENNTFKKNSQKFGALNIRHALNNEIDISGYIISSNSNTATEIFTENSYQNNANPLNENRTTTTNGNNFLTLGKITLDYNPSFQEDLAYNSFVKLTQNKDRGLINTQTSATNNTIETFYTIAALTLKQNISYNRKLNDKHTGILEATYEYIKNSPHTEWNTHNQILEGLIPIVTSKNYNIIQIKKSKAHNFNSILKDYWVINNSNHIYFSLGTNAAFNTFVNEDVQQLESGATNNFSSDGFGNDISYNFIDSYLGLEYKFRIGIFTFKPAVYHHFYNWSINQMSISKTYFKAFLLPEFTTEIAFENSAKINLKYKVNARFASIDNLADNFILTNFNSVFKGNSYLENELYQSASVFYSKYSLSRDIRINANINYNKKIKQFKNDTRLEGINQFSTPVLFNLPENSWTFSGRFSKKIKKIQTKIYGNHSISDFYQILNTNPSKNKSIRTSGTFGIETLFKKGPNLELNYSKQVNKYTSIIGESTFITDNIDTYLDYIFLKDFTIKSEYSFNSYTIKQNKIKNTFDNASVSVFYQKEDSPWGFEIGATNLFDTKFKQNNSFSSFLISDSKTFILPRIILFKIFYKL